MKRLYNFFLLLFITIFILSFIFSLSISRGIYAIIQVNENPENILLGEIPFRVHLETALWHALIFSAVLFSSQVFLFRSAYRLQKKFTMGMIVAYGGWFFALTLLVYGVIFAWFLADKSIIGLYLLTGHIFSLPHPAWWPFPLVWIALFIFYAEKIKNNPDYGR